MKHERALVTAFAGILALAASVLSGAACRRPPDEIVVVTTPLYAEAGPAAVAGGDADAGTPAPVAVDGALSAPK